VTKNQGNYQILSSTPPDITLSARHLTRSFGKKQVVHDVTLELKRGEVLGLLGHNGAGKTTTLQMLAGCLLPDSGEIEICGINLSRQPLSAKKHLGYLPETPPLYREFTVDDYLIFTVQLRGMKRSEAIGALAQAVQCCGLETVRKKIIGTLSKGYQQRVGIAQAIIHRPAVIVLDEPTVGLDPAQIRDIRTMIRELGNSGSVIISTHLLGEVESLCDRVEIMRHGRLIYSDTRSRMQERGSISGFIVSLRNPPPLSELESMAGIVSVEQLSGTRFQVLHTPEENPGETLVALAVHQGWQLEQLTPLQGTLEDVFVNITNAGEKTGDALKPKNRS
jgi:ABC-2 type transport system ATP-binding protein